MGNQKVKRTRPKKKIPPCKRQNKTDSASEIKLKDTPSVPAPVPSSSLTPLTSKDKVPNNNTSTSAITITARRRFGRSSTATTTISTSVAASRSTRSASTTSDLTYTGNTNNNSNARDTPSPPSSTSCRHPTTTPASAVANISVHEPVSSSGKKLRVLQKPSTVASTDDNQDLGYGLVDLNLLKQFIDMLSCEKCYGRLDTTVQALAGVAISLEVTCLDPTCKHKYTKAMSDTLHSSEGKMKKSYEVNRRFITAVTSIGGHEAACQSVAADLKLPPPVHSYSAHINDMSAIAAEVALKSTSKAANEIKSIQGRDISVSFDGTWQKRGFSSKNGIATAMTNMGKNAASKVIDTEILTTYCNGCKQQNKDTIKLKTIKDHVCTANHQGSSGKMEVDGIMRIYERSETQHDARYTAYLGDGDSKSYNAVAASKIYGDCEIKKLECTGHVQKRMGKALINLVADNKNKTFVVNNHGVKLNKPVANKNRNEKLYRGIGGNKRLTGAAIKSIQGHYGAAIRENDNISDMRAAIWAIFYHRSGDHSKCLTWCPAVQSGDVATADKHKLPPFVCDIMKPVFERLSSDDLLEKCIHGGTQNNNESFHHVIWARCPKETFCNKPRMQMAVGEATVLYNEGHVGRLELLKAYGLCVGPTEEAYAYSKDSKRVRQAELASSDATKAIRKRKAITIADNSYGAGEH